MPTKEEVIIIKDFVFILRSIDTYYVYAPDKNVYIITDSKGEYPSDSIPIDNLQSKFNSEICNFISNFKFVVKYNEQIFGDYTDNFLFHLSSETVNSFPDWLINEIILRKLTE